MGCGSSSLKGEKVDDIKPEPAIKKVRTNFSDVDFSGEAGNNNRRLTMAVAPDEQRRPTKISENVDDDIGPGGLDPPPTTLQTTDTAKQPYQDESDALASPVATTAPQLQLSPEDATTDPTSGPSKDTFASSNDPANHQQQPKPQQESSKIDTTNNLITSDAGMLSASSASEDQQQPRRKSWLARLAGSGSGSEKEKKEISDEELQRNIGMTRAEFEEWKKDPKNKVGPRQMPADGSTVTVATG